MVIIRYAEIGPPNEDWLKYFIVTPFYFFCGAFNIEGYN